METKTIEQHLQDLPEPYRSQALKNMWWEDKDNKYELQSEALYQAFNWSKSPEGFKYWNDFYYGKKTISTSDLDNL